MHGWIQLEAEKCSMKDKTQPQYAFDCFDSGNMPYGCLFACDKWSMKNENSTRLVKNLFSFSS